MKKSETEWIRFRYQGGRHRPVWHLPFQGSLQSDCQPKGPFSKVEAVQVFPGDTIPAPVCRECSRKYRFNHGGI